VLPSPHSHPSRPLSRQNNCLRALPPLDRLPRLRKLLLDGNSLAAAAPPRPGAHAGAGGYVADGAGRAHTLHTLSLARNQITAIEAPAAAGGGGPASDDPTGGGALATWCGRSLEELRLAGNQLACLAPLRGCCVLRTIDVGRNRLTSLQGLEGAPLLQSLLAPHNLLATFEPSLLAGWPLLQRLDVSSNRLGGVLPRLPPMLHLHTLSLSDNALTGLDPPRAGALPQLARLDLSFNEFEDTGLLADLARLPDLAELQLHDTPLAASPGYAAAVARLLPGLSELDRARPGERRAPAAPAPAAAAAAAGPAAAVQLAAADAAGAGAGGAAGEAGRDAGDEPGPRDVMALRAFRAAAGSAGVAQQLARHLATTPGARLGARPAQWRATAQHWLPALQARAWGEAALEVAAQWGFETAVSLAEAQARQQIALATLKSRCCDARRAEASGRPASAAAAAPVVEAAQGETLPPWLRAWRAETGQDAGGAGCPELAAGLRLLAMAAAEGQPAEGSPSSSDGSNSGSGSTAEQRPSWLEAQEGYEELAMAIARRHLGELLQPPSTRQEVLWVHGAYAQRAASLRAAAKLAEAATALQAAWRGRSARAVAAAAARERAAAAAVALQATLRGRTARAARPMLALRAAQEARRLDAATTLQAHLRGWLARRRLAAALALARRSASGGSSARAQGLLGSEVSLEGVEDDFFAGLRLSAVSSSSGRGRSADAGACSGPAGGATSPQGAVGAAGSGDQPPLAHGAGSSIGSGSNSDADSGSSSGGDGSGSGSEAGAVGCDASVAESAAAAREARLDAKLRGLMAEWGFADLATARAYHK
jgi:Leucine-rich repeat (LRR) protein